MLNLNFNQSPHTVRPMQKEKKMTPREATITFIILLILTAIGCYFGLGAALVGM